MEGIERSNRLKSQTLFLLDSGFHPYACCVFDAPLAALSPLSPVPLSTPVAVSISELPTALKRFEENGIRQPLARPQLKPDAPFAEYI